MRALFILFVASLVVTSAWAQLPDGSTAPDFTAKDINGKTWHLYDILATGRPVVMDVSATWCGPCWNYHNSHALETLWEQHGPAGDGNAFVLFVEGDGATNVECLYGAAGCNNSTQGNWVAGTPYPIINSSAISSQYAVNAFPTVYRICPDRKVYELGQLPAASLWSSIEPCVGNIPTNYATVSGLVGNSLSNQICQPQVAQPIVELLSLGTAHLNSATLELSFNGTPLQTKTWTGDLTAFSSGSFQFDPVTISEAGTLSVKVLEANGQPNAEPSSTNFTYYNAPKLYATPQIQFTLQTDQSGKDIYWEVVDDAGNVLKSGGNQAVGPNGGGLYPQGVPTHPSAYPDLTLVKDTFNAPANGCFTLRVVDGAGNGLASPGRYRLYNMTNLNTPFLTNAPFSTVGKNTIAPKEVVGTDQLLVENGINVYPNPATNMLHVDFVLSDNADVQIFVTDAAGKIVRNEIGRTFVSGENQANISVETLANGLYFLQLKTATGTVARKFTVSK